VFEAAASLGAIMHVEKLLAGSMAVSDDWMAMRSAAAEAIEMLDGVGTWADAGSLARKAALVLREMMVKLDARYVHFDGDALTDDKDLPTFRKLQMPTDTMLQSLHPRRKNHRH
jgi:hypothetical protein